MDGSASKESASTSVQESPAWSVASPAPLAVAPLRPGVVRRSLDASG
jgi:hypothetical protein